MLLLALAALALPTPDPAPVLAPDPYRRPRCQTVACERRVGHRRTLARWRRVTRPHRAWLLKVRLCESGNRYAIATGNGYYGAYQFDTNSWRAVGGSGLPHLAPPLEQDYRAVRLLYVQGRAAWPVCGR
jgi:hypothetical protein